MNPDDICSESGNLLFEGVICANRDCEKTYSKKYHKFCCDDYKTALTLGKKQTERLQKYVIKCTICKGKFVYNDYFVHAVIC